VKVPSRSVQQFFTYKRTRDTYIHTHFYRFHFILNSIEKEIYFCFGNDSCHFISVFFFWNFLSAPLVRFPIAVGVGESSTIASNDRNARSEGLEPGARHVGPTIGEPANSTTVEGGVIIK
jgi:hypothetical protein